jgi:hypothetical protein
MQPRLRQKIYQRKTKVLEVMRWLRANGTRGIDWESHGGTRLDIFFANEELELAYIMVWDWYDPDPNTNNRI